MATSVVKDFHFATKRGNKYSLVSRGCRTETLSYRARTYLSMQRCSKISCATPGVQKSRISAKTNSVCAYGFRFALFAKSYKHNNVTELAVTHNSKYDARWIRGSSALYAFRRGQNVISYIF